MKQLQHFWLGTFAIIPTLYAAIITKMGMTVMVTKRAVPATAAKTSMVVQEITKNSKLNLYTGGILPVFLF